MILFSQGLTRQKIRVHGIEVTGGTCSGALEKDKRAPLYSFSRESNFPPLGDFIRFVYLRTLHNEENYKYSALTLHSVKEMLWKILIVIVPERSGIV